MKIALMGSDTTWYKDYETEKKKAKDYSPAEMRAEKVIEQKKEQLKKFPGLIWDFKLFSTIDLRRVDLELKKPYKLFVSFKYGPITRNEKKERMITHYYDIIDYYFHPNRPLDKLNFNVEHPEEARIKLNDRGRMETKRRDNGGQFIYQSEFRTDGILHELPEPLSVKSFTDAETGKNVSQLHEKKFIYVTDPLSPLDKV